MRAGRLALAFLVVVALIAAIDIAARAIGVGTGIATSAIDASITALCFLAYPWISPAVLEAVAKTPEKSAKQASPSPAIDLRLEPELELERNFEQLTVTAQRLANEAGIRAPRLVMVDDPGHIAFGVGMPSRSTIFITKGLSNHVTASTLEGILAHEIGHISSRHTLVQAFVFAGLFAGKTLIGIPGGLAPMILLGYLAVLRQCEFAARGIREGRGHAFRTAGAGERAREKTQRCARLHQLAQGRVFDAPQFCKAHCGGPSWIKKPTSRASTRPSLFGMVR